MQHLLPHRPLQFGYGLKEAAARLNICPTTLKRACRCVNTAQYPQTCCHPAALGWWCVHPVLRAGCRATLCTRCAWLLTMLWLDVLQAAGRSALAAA